MRVCIQKSTGKLIEAQSGGSTTKLITQPKLDADGKPLMRAQPVKRPEVVGHDKEGRPILRLVTTGVRSVPVMETAEVPTTEHLDVLVENAVVAGYKASDVEAKFVTDAEYEALMAALPRPAPRPSLEDVIAVLTPEQSARLAALMAGKH